MQQRVSKVLWTKSQFLNRSLYSIEMQSVTLGSLPVNVMKMLLKCRLQTNWCPKTQLVKLKLKTVNGLQYSITVSILWFEIDWLIESNFFDNVECDFLTRCGIWYKFPLIKLLFKFFHFFIFVHPLGHRGEWSSQKKLKTFIACFSHWSHWSKWSQTCASSFLGLLAFVPPCKRKVKHCLMKPSLKYLRSQRESPRRS